MQDHKNILEPEGTYHIYNRANGHEKLFVNGGNYRFFLKKYEHYITPVADTFCYCLLPNHFHFLLRIKHETVIEDVFLLKSGKGSKALEGFQTLQGLEKQQALSKFISRQFSHLFNTYAQAFNKQQNRKGSLFIPRFNRKRIDSEEYLRKAVHYIHYNPVKAGCCSRPGKWEFSSYKAIMSNLPTFVARQEVQAWFGNLENFIYCHEEIP